MAPTNRWTVRRLFIVQAAHRIQGHPGACANLHGHSYEVEVVVRGHDLDPLGMVADFSDLKRSFQQAVGSWDHKTLLDARDPLGPALQADGVQCVFLPQPPTVEVLSRAAFDVLLLQLRRDFPHQGKQRQRRARWLHSVTFSENRDLSATFEGDPSTSHF